MKFPYPTLSRLMSGRSAIVEPGDGEMTVPPVLQPVLDIFSPVANLSPNTGPMQDTFMFDSRLTVIGLDVARTESFPTLAAGRWDVQIQHTSLLSVTTNLASANSVFIFDPDGGSYAVSRFNLSSGPNKNSVGITIPLLTTRNGWFFQNSRGATVALDECTSNVWFYARRIF